MKAKFNGKEYNVSFKIDGSELEVEVVLNNSEIEEVKEELKERKRKFKAGDNVRIKEGISSKTHIDIGPSFESGMDEFIGMNLTVAGYTEEENVFFNEDEMKYVFAEDWIESWSDEKEELKEGDLAIFWDYNGCNSLLKVFSKKQGTHYYDDCGTPWKHAVKFENKEKYDKVRKGEITL